MLSITSDYFQSEGDPQPYLKRIAEAGFTHVHWCHHWDTDFIYSQDEIDAIDRWFKDYGLHLLNLHASQGREKYWLSPKEYQRKAGVALVQNRIEMAARLDGDVVILHIPTTAPVEDRPAALVQIRKSLDELEPFARQYAIRIALENMPGDDFTMLGSLFSEYGRDYLGLCYDSGHGNLDGKGLEHFAEHQDRLIAVHLHDNDGGSDQHKIPFTGTVAWDKLASLVATSAYTQCVNLEVVIKQTGYTDETLFLQQSYLAGEKLAAMIGAGQ